jgi:hypothetical protein
VPAKCYLLLGAVYSHLLYTINSCGGSAADRLPTGFCIKPLLGSKYDGVPASELVLMAFAVICCTIGVCLG